MHLYPVKRGRTARWLLGSAAVFVAVMVLFVCGLSSVSRRATQERQALTERAIERALVSCYASEGAYPSSLAYLEEHYGLCVDHERYVVDYELLGSNIWPAVHVAARGAAQPEAKGGDTP